MTLRSLSKQATLNRDKRIIELLTRDKNPLSVKAVAAMFHRSEKTIYWVLSRRIDQYKSV